MGRVKFIEYTEYTQGMVSDSNGIKNIKVSDQVHEELSVRKYRDETFDDVLRRVLGLLPQTVEELTAVLPNRLATTTNSIVENYVSHNERYRKIGEKQDNHLTLYFVSHETDKIIYQISVYLPSPRAERVNHRVDISYRNPTGEIERIVLLRDSEKGTVNIEEYKHFDTYEKRQNTRKGDDAGEETAKLVGPHVSKFVNQAYKRWGSQQRK